MSAVRRGQAPRSAQGARRAPDVKPRIRGLFRILPYLYMGDAEASRNATELKRLGITHIVNCVAEDIENYFEEDSDSDSEDDPTPSIKKKTKKYTPTYTSIPLEEDIEMNIGQYFDEVYDVIKGYGDKHKEATARERSEGIVIPKEAVLVHCTNSKSIAPSFCMAFILKSCCEQGKNMTLQAAYKHIGNQEPGLHPSDSCLKQLIVLEGELFEGQQTMRVAARMKQRSDRRRGKGRNGKGRRGK